MIQVLDRCLAPITVAFVPEFATAGYELQDVMQVSQVVGFERSGFGDKLHDVN